VSGLLDRLAARASGEEAGVVPRVPARFEPAGRPHEAAPARASSPGLAARTDGREAHADPAPALPLGEPRPKTRSVPSARPTTGAVEATDPHAVLGKHRGTADRPAPPASAPLGPEMSPGGPGTSPLPRTGSPRRSGPARAGDRAAMPRPTAVVPTPQPVVPVAPAPLATPELRPMSSAPTTAPTVVHVSIGRVEVRAALPRPEPPAGAASSSADERATALSLTEYLRGGR
jgi:hypothetical protein